MFTPFEIHLLIHFYSCGSDASCINDAVGIGSEAGKTAIGRFQEEGLITPDGVSSSAPVSAFTITPKGRALVDMLCASQIPTMQWVNPDTGLVIVEKPTPANVKNGDGWFTVTGISDEEMQEHAAICAKYGHKMERN